MSAAGTPASAGGAELADLFTFRWADFPPLTRALPGTGGVIRGQPEDFVVTEIPTYLPSGDGSHAYALVRKRGLTTRDLMVALQRAGVAERSIGVAGLKDKYAVTTQWLSVPRAAESALDALAELEGVEILERSRHRNKLGIGHLRGNRFTVRITGTGPGAGEAAERVLAELARRGVPNYFGPQRFGAFGRNAWDGYRLVRGENVPGGHRLKRFFVAALQSLLFNALLAERLEAGLFERVVLGDWARKHDTGGTFLVEDEREAARAEAGEISATLPLYGKKVRPSGGRAGEFEQLVLDRYGLRWMEFTGRHGDRRFSRIFLEDVAAAATDGAVTLSFTLPKGSYATSVLREVMKVDVDEGTPGLPAEHDEAED